MRLHPIATPAPVLWPELRDFRLECGKVLAHPYPVAYWDVSSELGLPELSALIVCRACLRNCEQSDPKLLRIWYVLAEAQELRDREAQVETDCAVSSR